MPSYRAVVYSDAQRFEKYRKESSGYWDNEVTVDSNASFKDVGSYTDKGETPVSTPYAYEAPSCTVTTWNPSSNYDYKKLRRSVYYRYELIIHNRSSVLSRCICAKC